MPRTSDLNVGFFFNGAATTSTPIVLTVILQRFLPHFPAWYRKSSYRFPRASTSTKVSADSTIWQSVHELACGSMSSMSGVALLHGFPPHFELARKTSTSAMSNDAPEPFEVITCSLPT